MKSILRILIVLFVAACNKPANNNNPNPTPNTPNNPNNPVQLKDTTLKVTGFDSIITVYACDSIEIPITIESDSGNYDVTLSLGEFPYRVKGELSTISGKTPLQSTIKIAAGFVSGNQFMRSYYVADSYNTQKSFPDSLVLTIEKSNGDTKIVKKYIHYTSKKDLSEWLYYFYKKSPNWILTGGVKGPVLLYQNDTLFADSIYLGNYQGNDYYSGKISLWAYTADGGPGFFGRTVTGYSSAGLATFDIGLFTIPLYHKHPVIGIRYNLRNPDNLNLQFYGQFDIIY